MASLASVPVADLVVVCYAETFPHTSTFTQRPTPTPHQAGYNVVEEEQDHVQSKRQGYPRHGSALFFCLALWMHCSQRMAPLLNIPQPCISSGLGGPPVSFVYRSFCCWLAAANGQLQTLNKEKSLGCNDQPTVHSRDMQSRGVSPGVAAETRPLQAVMGCQKQRSTVLGAHKVIDRAAHCLLLINAKDGLYKDDNLFPVALSPYPYSPGHPPLHCNLVLTCSSPIATLPLLSPAFCLVSTFALSLRLHTSGQAMADVAELSLNQKLSSKSSPCHGPVHGSQHTMATRSNNGTSLLRRGGPDPLPQLPGLSIGGGNLKRKRAGSNNTDEANHPRPTEIVVQVPTSSPFAYPNSDSGEHICLCTPAPKVPRPRNGESLSLLSPRSKTFKALRLHVSQLAYRLCSLLEKVPAPQAHSITRLLTDEHTPLDSFHPLPATSPSPGCGSAPGTGQPRNLQDNWRAVARPARRGKE